MLMFRLWALGDAFVFLCSSDKQESLFYVFRSCSFSFMFSLHSFSKHSTGCWCQGFQTSSTGGPFFPQRKSSVQFSSVAQSGLTLCNPMNCSTPGLPVHHQLLEFTQTHVHRVSDAIQPSHPLSSPSPPARNPSPHQSLFQ